MKEAEEKQAALKMEEEVTSGASAAACDPVGDVRSKLCHQADESSGVFARIQLSSGEAGCLADVSTPVYFSSVLEAASQSY